MGKFLSQVTMSALKHEMEIFNSKLKRGEVEKPEDIASVWHVYCGCGHEQCCFIYPKRRETPQEK